MRRAVVALALLLGACHGNRDRIIADVCKPINADPNASAEKLAAAKGYDTAEVRKVCHQYAMDQMAEAERMMRELGVHRSGPYDAN